MQHVHVQALSHGNLSGENVLVDPSTGIVWVTNLQPRFAKVGHVLQDIAKLMTHILFELTPLSDEEQLKTALRLTEELTAAQNLLQEEGCVAAREARLEGDRLR